jgi:hypothetical protein
MFDLEPAFLADRKFIVKKILIFIFGKKPRITRIWAGSGERTRQAGRY